MAVWCFDTSAWLEYFNAGRHGPRIRTLVEGRGDILTPAVVAAELVEAARRRGLNTRQFLAFLQSKSEVAPVDADVARRAGMISAERGDDGDAWTIVESMVLATAQARRARLATRDPIYQDWENVEWLDAA